MKVDEALIKRIAELARLNLTDKEVKKFEPEFKEILDVFSKLDEVKVDSVKPSFQPVSIKNFMREDKIGECKPRDKVLELTEHKKDGYFKGPKAV